MEIVDRRGKEGVAEEKGLRINIPYCLTVLFDWKKNSRSSIVNCTFIFHVLSIVSDQRDRNLIQEMRRHFEQSIEETDQLFYKLCIKRDTNVRKLMHSLFKFPLRKKEIVYRLSYT